ncbi:radical SAM family heme chaperone HemW [bacterium]|nr:radical SAM family heme chaperone HemW [bacterium]
MKSIYIHVPFCRAKCPYCDFSSGPATDAEEINDYFAALEKEIAFRVQGTCASIFFGGGTPSLVPVEKITHSLKKITDVMQIPGNTEITLEVNPATVDEEKLRQYKSAGINRISLGVQSTQDRQLNLLGRYHSSSQAYEAFQMIRHVGFENISCDIIYGLPDQSLADFQNDMETITAWQPEHFSLYVLSVEEKTPLYEKISTGELPMPDDDVAADMLAWSRNFLEEKGYFQYELCSFSKKGKQCRHNLGYWNDNPYIGLGTSAHSFIEGIRSWNTLSLQAYNQMTHSKGEARVGQEALDDKGRVAESILLRLRLTEGLKKKDYQGKSPFWEKDFIPILKKFEMQGLVTFDSASIRLTKKGMLLSDIVFRELL